MVKPFFSFSQSAPTVSVSRARETISRKKEEKVKLIFISASIGHSFELACLRGFFLQFCTTCSLLRSRRSTLEMCFLGLPGEHICLKIFFVMSVPTWNLGSDRDQQRGRIRKVTVGSWRDRCRLLHNISINSKMHLCILKRTKNNTGFITVGHMRHWIPLIRDAGEAAGGADQLVPHREEAAGHLPRGQQGSRRLSRWKPSRQVLSSHCWPNSTLMLSFGIFTLDSVHFQWTLIDFTL